MDEMRKSESIIEELESIFYTREYVCDLLSELKDAIISHDEELKAACNNYKDMYGNKMLENNIMKTMENIKNKKIKELREALYKLEDIIECNANKKWLGMDEIMLDIIKKALEEE